MDKKTTALLEAFHNGSCTRAYELLGCHHQTRRSVSGYVFRVWAPNAQAVSLVGDFNEWDPDRCPMEHLAYGVWECFSPEPKEGSAYRFALLGADGSVRLKSDPYAFRTQAQPGNASLVCTEDGHTWSDGKWMREATLQPVLNIPMNIYEIHLGSWRRRSDGSVMTYEEIADPLVAYLKDMGYTHVEFMPLTEYPYDPSWGYQVTGYFAPTARYGAPAGLKCLVEKLHKAGIGVILDWVPGHFPKDEWGLVEFDGGACYENPDPMMNEHPDWTTRIFDYGRPEVRSFLVSSAVYWLEVYHMDGLRVDAVSSMLYLDYNRPVFRPNRYGGRENLEAIELLRAVNRAAFKSRPNAIMVAEESTAFPMVTRPDFDGGLGFLFKWNMGWMNDTLNYMGKDPVYRRYEHAKLTFPMVYAFAENFILPLSHDEVVHGKKSLVEKMPGDYDQRFANLRAMFGYMMATPGKKLQFMGGEFAQFAEWRWGQALDWALLAYDRHRQMQDFVRDLNALYLTHPQLWQNDQDWDGYQWIQPDAQEENLIAFRRIDRRHRELLVICNFCPVERRGFRLGVPRRGVYKPLLCSDDLRYGGTGSTVRPAVSQRVDFRDYKLSALFDIPAMSVTFYIRENQPRKEDSDT